MRIPIACLAVVMAALAAMAVVARAGDGPDADHPIVVGKVRQSLGDVQRPGHSGPVAGNLAMERAWLEGELRAAPGVPLDDLRVRVADRLAGHLVNRRGREARQAFAAAFERFHARWRARTRCIAPFHDPFMDRCADQPASAQGTCHWMGETTVCRVAVVPALWLVLGPGRSERRFRAKSTAVQLAMKTYAAGRVARVAARRRAAAERARRQRLADGPRLSAPGLQALAPACRRYRRDMELYEHGAMQDPHGWGEGVLVARRRLVRSLAEAPLDGIDRRKVRPLAASVRAGSAQLTGRGARVGNLPALLRRFTRLARREDAQARALGLSACARVRPG